MIEKWEIFETSVCGPEKGNPFIEQWVSGHFTGMGEDVNVDGFYDGKGIYKIRFMPSCEGTYHYAIRASFLENSVTGSFAVKPATGNNHGIVRVACENYFAYEDGTPYYPLGTTCYAWQFQKTEVVKETLQTLAEAPFNKLRFCVYPKHYSYNEEAPSIMPYVRGNGEGLDSKLARIFREGRMIFPKKIICEDFSFNYYKFNVEYFQMLDYYMDQLKVLGIEADLILMHPYDRWGHTAIDKRGCELYIRYMVARYSAYRNLWWSLANEFDLVTSKKEEDWESYGDILQEKDPYRHLCSIHNFRRLYDYSRPWITHCSIQRLDSYKSTEETDKYIAAYGKPVVWDEIGYEGNLPESFGNLLPEELVRLCWEAAMRGGYGQHGETYLDESNIIWWSHGGKLRGKSPERLAFLYKILSEVPGGYLKLDPFCYGHAAGIPLAEDKKDITSPPCSCEIHYLGFRQSAKFLLYLPEDKKYQVEVIDTWNMVIENRGEVSGVTMISLPGRPYMAIRIRAK